MILTVAGDVDLAVHAAFQAALDEQWQGAENLVIDCSEITFLDSMGLRVLVQALQTATTNNHTFALAAPSAPVLRVLELAGVQSLFPVVDSIPDDGDDSDGER
ncbi:hypothetical protein GCM10009839_00540 [Catenulispora yoronensis]|uniref:Anti-sigma factor antagonist n=1 Tax=Catenulispora yoronensis TaxID=450799 RepID=A0ABP5F1S9_9ACTN